MTLPVHLVVSLDTEENNWQPARAGITVENIRELPRLHRPFEGLGVRETCFTAYQVAIGSWSAGILKELHSSGNAEIAAHLHPWNTPPLEEPFLPRSTMTVNPSPRLQRAKIERLTTTLTELCGERPGAFRAGRWGLGSEMVAALIASGCRVDSSVIPFVSWDEYDDGPAHDGAALEHLHMFWHTPSLRPGLSPFARTSKDVEPLYAHVEDYLEKLSAFAAIRCTTISEAARDLAVAA